MVSDSKTADNMWTVSLINKSTARTLCSIVVASYATADFVTDTLIGLVDSAYENAEDGDDRFEDWMVTMGKVTTSFEGDDNQIHIYEKLVKLFGELVAVHG